MRIKETISAGEVGALEDVLPELKKEEKTRNVEATKRADVEGLNKAARNHVERAKNEYELDDGQRLFIALLEGLDKDIEDKLYHYVYGREYMLAHDGGEPELLDILAIKLLEKLRNRKMYGSMIYQDVYLKHVGIKYKGKGKGRVNNVV